MEALKVDRLASPVGLVKHVAFRQPIEDRSSKDLVYAAHTAALFSCMLTHVCKVLV